MSVPLYQLAHELQELTALADTEELPVEVIRDTLEGIEGAIEVKTANIAKLTRNLEASAQAIRDAARAMIERAERVERRADSIKAYLLWAMQAGDIQKIECPEFKISRRKNPVSVVIDEWHELPDIFKVQKPSPLVPDKKAIKAAIDNGQKVPGAHLFQNERVEIKEC